MTKKTRYFDDYASAYNYYGGTSVPSSEIALVGNASYVFVSSDNSYTGGNTQYYDANMTNDDIVNTMTENAYTAGTTYGYDLGYTAGTSYGYDLGYTAGYSAGYSIGYDEGYAAGQAVVPPTPTPETTICQACAGTGFINMGTDPETGEPIQELCTVCGGTGQVPVA